MAAMSARTELSCKPRLFDILDSQNGCSTPEMIDYSRKMDHRTSFDEECRKIQCEGDMAGETVNGSERSLRDLIQEDMQVLKQREKGTVVKRQRGNKQPAEIPATHKHRDEGRLSEGFRTGVVLKKHDRVDVNLQQGGMGARSFADHIFGHRRFESSKPFSEALEVLNSDKDLIMDILSEPSCLLKKCSRHLQTERGTFSSVFDHQLPASTKTCPASQQSKKPATLKSELQNGKSSGKVGCHCSSGQPRDGSSSRALNGSLTYFSVREIKRKLNHTFGRSRRRRRRRRKEPNSDSVTSGKLSHSRSIFGHDCIYRGVEAKSPSSYSSNAKAKEKLGSKQGLKVETEQPHVDWETDTVRRKIDVSSQRWSVDVDSIATGDLPTRLEDIDDEGRVVSSCLSPRRVSQYCPGSARVSYSPYRQRFCPSPVRSSKELTVTPYDSMTETVSTETSSSLVPTSDEEERDGAISPTRNMKFNDMPNVAETNSIVHSEAGYDTVQRAANIKLQDEYGTLLHSEMEYFPSSPTRITQLDMHDTKNQEEHLSPVSVLDQFFAEEYSSPSNTASQSGRDPLKPRRLHFEECTSAPPSQAAPVTASQCVHKQDYTICNFVRAIIKASSLDWDQLLAIRPLSEHLLHPSIFDQAQFLLSNSHFDTRLLVDHVNEVLLQTQRSHFVSPYWPALAKPRICCLPLEEAVIDEIMREAQFYLLPQTQKRTLDQLVAKDLSSSRMQLDLRPETEHIIVHISEAILEESVLDVILQLHS